MVGDNVYLANAFFIIIIFFWSSSSTYMVVELIDQNRCMHIHLTCHLNFYVSFKGVSYMKIATYMVKSCLDIQTNQSCLVDLAESSRTFTPVVIQT